MKRIGLLITLILSLTLSGCQVGVATPPRVAPQFPPTQTPASPDSTPAPTQPPPAVVVTNPPPPLVPSQRPSTAAPTQPASAVPGSPDVLVSARQRISAPAASDANLHELAQGNTAFALDLYHALLKQDPGNLIVSPYSISLALAMTYAGARGQTEQQMAQTLHFTLPQARLHPAFNALDLALHGAGAGQADDQFQLNIANSLWGQKGFPFESTFIDQLAENYGAGLRLADFAAAPEPARKNINDWVSQQTKNKINDLLPSGSVTPDTRLVLANAIYFYAKWLNPFDANLTHAGDFNLLDGTTASVSLMSLGHGADLRYAAGSGYQAVELPYQGGKTAMLLIVPDKGHFTDVQKALTAQTLDQIDKNLQTKKVELTMPKFKYDSSVSLSDTLGQLGLSDAITPGTADFSGMDGARDLYISAVLHKAYVAVDEAGTEAAAATAVIVGLMAMPVTDVVQLTIDRPFIFAIRDAQTGSLLFLGQVTKPQ